MRRVIFVISPRPTASLGARLAALLLPALLLASACAQGRPVKIVRVDQSAVVGTLVTMQPDAVEITTSSGTRIVEPRAGIASIDVPSEPELAALRVPESRWAGGPGTGPGTGTGTDAGAGAGAGAENGGGAARAGDASGHAGDSSPTAAGGESGGAGKDAPGGGRQTNPSGGGGDGDGDASRRDDPRLADRTSAGTGTSAAAGAGGANGGNASGGSANGGGSAAGGRAADGPSRDGGGNATASGRGPGITIPGNVAMPGNIAIPANTVLALSLDAPLQSDGSRPEERVDATLTAPLIVDRAQVLPAGTRLRGDVIEAVPAKQAGGRGRLAIRFHTLVLGGESIPIVTAPVRYVAAALTRGDAKKVGLGAAAGAFVGGIMSKTKKGLGLGAAAGGGATAIAVSRNNEMRLNRGASLSVRLTEPIPVRAR